jgi:hypothetical protein
MADTPRITSITPASAPAGAELTVAGTAFGASTAGSAVRFRVPEAGAAPVAGTVVAWAAESIRVHVPTLASFGSGGPLEIVVHTDAGDSPASAFMLLEASPPAITSLTPARGLQGDRITIAGERFGRQAAGSAVRFQRPGSADVPAQVIGWTPTTVVATVPELAALGGAGQRSVTVSAAWGTSSPADFLLGELPGVESVDPDSPAPGATITVRGRAFGPRESGRLELVTVYDTDVPPAQRQRTTPQILSWSDTEIEARLQDYRSLRTTGPRDVVVTSEWGASVPGQGARILIEDRASITMWTRLEPHARTSDLQAGLALGLQAQIADPLWMLGRQWQMLELQGEDAGSPVSVRVDGTRTPLARWRPAGGQPASVPAGVPLETVVERERVIPPPAASSGSFDDLRFSAEAGLQLLRMVDAQLRDPAKRDDYRKRFLREYPLDPAPETAASLDAATRRFLGVMQGRAPDGARMYADFRTVLDAKPRLPAKPPINGNDRAGVLAAMQAWYGWCADLFSQPGAEDIAWNRQRMEYGFSAGSGALVLDAAEHDGGHLDWYVFNRAGTGASLGQPEPGRGPAAFSRRAIPSPVSYPGMPVPRWWELEDRRVDFGAVAAGPSELLKLVLIELATVFGNDWFTVPLDAMPVGAHYAIGAVTVTDAFGVSVSLDPFGDGAGTDWRMFELSGSDGVADAGSQMLILDALPSTLESAPVEEVLLLRDEMANMAWAVEKTVESRTGRPLDRHEEEVTRRAQPAPPASGSRRYVLQTAVPRNWIPLLPKVERDAAGAITLRLLARGAMRDPADGIGIPPVGRLLDPGTPLAIYDEEVPRAGARVVRQWTLARSADGRTLLWRGRRKGVGRGEGSSGLRFDEAARE